MILVDAFKNITAELACDIAFLYENARQETHICFTISASEGIPSVLYTGRETAEDAIASHTFVGHDQTNEVNILPRVFNL